MLPDRHRTGGGFVLLSAVILLLLLAGIGAVMVTLSTVQNTTSSQDLQGSRAYQAARSGVEWGLVQVLQNNRCDSQSGLVLPANTLASFALHLTCTSNVYTEGEQQITVYQVIAVATSGIAGNAGYVERQLSSTFSTCLLAGSRCAD
jgi:MSHA biogenesis protein MshP